MSLPNLAQPPYSKRDVPGAYERGWLSTELGNIQRAIPSMNIKTITADYTPVVGDATLLCDTTAAGLTVALPQPSGVQGLVLTIKKVDLSGHVVTINGRIDGSPATTTLTIQYASRTIQSDGVQWYILAKV